MTLKVHKSTSIISFVSNVVMSIVNSIISSFLQLWYYESHCFPNYNNGFFQLGTSADLDDLHELSFKSWQRPRHVRTRSLELERVDASEGRK